MGAEAIYVSIGGGECTYFIPIDGSCELRAMIRSYDRNRGRLRRLSIYINLITDA